MRALLIIATLSGCAAAAVPPLGPPAAPGQLPAGEAARNFVAVAEAVEPVAEQVCRERAPAGLSCDFVIVIDDRPGLPPQAFQVRGPDGRPLIGFTLPLVADARNRDELAFVMGHEASHHIAVHLERQTASAAAGAAFAEALARSRGADAATAARFARVGAGVGARTFSRDFELEADALGTLIAERAGFDPVRGAKFFARLPDPGDQFLGTHPPNAERTALVARVAASLGRTGS